MNHSIERRLAALEHRLTLVVTSDRLKLKQDVADILAGRPVSTRTTGPLSAAEIADRQALKLEITRLLAPTPRG